MLGGMTTRSREHTTQASDLRYEFLSELPSDGRPRDESIEHRSPKGYGNTERLALPINFEPRVPETSPPVKTMSSTGSRAEYTNGVGRQTSQNQQSKWYHWRPSGLNDTARLSEDLDRSQQEQHALRKSLRAMEDDMALLRLQNQRLKAEIVFSAPTKQMIDSDIKHEIDRIFNGLNNLAIQMSRTARYDSREIPEETQDWLDQFVPSHKTLPHNSLHWIIVARVSRAIVKCFTPSCLFGGYIDGLESPAAEACRLTGLIQSATSLADRQWLLQTCDLINRECPDALQAARTALIEFLLARVSKWLRHVLNVPWNASISESMSKLFHSALNLFQSLQTQRARFCVYMVEAVATESIENKLRIREFDAEMMQETVAYEDESTLIGRQLEASVFPVVCRYGGDNSDSQNQRTVISRARVVLRSLEPGDTLAGGQYTRPLAERDIFTTNGVLDENRSKYEPPVSAIAWPTHTPDLNRPRADKRSPVLSPVVPQPSHQATTDETLNLAVANAKGIETDMAAFDGSGSQSESALPQTYIDHYEAVGASEEPPHCSLCASGGVHCIADYSKTGNETRESQLSYSRS